METKMLQNPSKNQSKNNLFFLFIFYSFWLHFGLQLEGPRGASESPFGLPFKLLGATWPNLTNLGQLGANLSQLGANLGQPGANLRPTWGQLGPTWDQFGANLAQLVANLEPT